MITPSSVHTSSAWRSDTSPQWRCSTILEVKRHPSRVIRLADRDHDALLHSSTPPTILAPRTVHQNFQPLAYSHPSAPSETTMRSSTLPAPPTILAPRAVHQYFHPPVCSLLTNTPDAGAVQARTLRVRRDSSLSSVRGRRRMRRERGASSGGHGAGRCSRVCRLLHRGCALARSRAACLSKCCDCVLVACRATGWRAVWCAKGGMLRCHGHMAAH